MYFIKLLSALAAFAVIAPAISYTPAAEVLQASISSLATQVADIEVEASKITDLSGLIHFLYPPSTGAFHTIIPDFESLTTNIMSAQTELQNSQGSTPFLASDGDEDLVLYAWVEFVQYHQDTLAAISAKASVENAFFSAISSKPLTSAFAAFQTAANNFGALLRQLCPDYVTYFDDEKYFLDGPIATVIAAYNGPLD